MIKTNVNAEPVFIEDAKLSADCCAELHAIYDNDMDYRITIHEDGDECSTFDAGAIDEAIEFLTLLKDDLVKRGA